MLIVIVNIVILVELLITLSLLHWQSCHKLVQEGVVNGMMRRKPNERSNDPLEHPSNLKIRSCLGLCALLVVGGDPLAPLVLHELVEESALLCKGKPLIHLQKLQ